MKSLPSLISKRSRDRGGSSSGESDAGGSSSGVKDDLMKSSAKAFRNQHERGRVVTGHSDNVVKEFLQMAQEELGVPKRQARTLTDRCRQQRTPKHRGRLQSMVLLAAVLVRSLSGRECKMAAVPSCLRAPEHRKTKVGLGTAEPGDTARLTTARKRALKAQQQLAEDKKDE